MIKDFEQISIKQGFMKHNGGLLFKTISEKEYEFKTVINENHLNAAGITHGGFIAAVVDAALGVEQDVQEVLGVGIVRFPAQPGERLEFLVFKILEVRGPLNLLDLNLNPQGLLPHFQDHFQVETDGAAGSRDSDHDARSAVSVGIC